MGIKLDPYVFKNINPGFLLNDQSDEVFLEAEHRGLQHPPSFQQILRFSRNHAGFKNWEFSFHWFYTINC